MKKFKLLPTVLMLVLCVGVLAVGVFAITPTKNTISGTITVGSAPAEVQLDCYVGDTSTTPTTYQSVRSGITWQPALNIGTGTANTIDEIPEYQLTIKVTNKSNKELGVYFLKGELASDGYATGDNIRTTATLTEKDLINNDGSYINPNKADAKNLVDVKFDVYKYLAPSGENGSVIEMKITFKCSDFITADGKVKFDYKLNIEEYKPNVGLTANAEKGIVALTAPTWKDGGDEITDEYGNTIYSDDTIITPGTNNAPAFVKLDKTVTVLDGIGAITSDAPWAQVYSNSPNFYKNTTIKYVVGTTALTKVCCENVEDYIDGYGGLVYGPFEGCSALEGVSLPALNVIGINAFKDCSALKEYAVSYTTTVCGGAFNGCNFDKFTILGNNEPVNISSGAFNNCVINKFIFSVDAATHSFSNGKLIIKSLTGVTFSAIVRSQTTSIEFDQNFIGTSFAQNQFSNFAKVKTINIPTTINSIGNKAFANCTMLQAIKVPEGVRTLGDGVFANCQNLSEVILPNTLTEINGYTPESVSDDETLGTFYNCNSLTNITIPQSVVKIEDSSFYDSGLTIEGLTYSTPEGKSWYRSYYDGDVFSYILVSTKVLFFDALKNGYMGGYKDLSEYYGTLYLLTPEELAELQGN